MDEERVEHAMFMINAFNSFEEAEAHRKKFKSPDLYGVFGMFKGEEKQLWVAVPKVALDALSNFKDES